MAHTLIDLAIEEEIQALAAEAPLPTSIKPWDLPAVTAQPARPTNSRAAASQSSAGHLDRSARLPLRRQRICRR